MGVCIILFLILFASLRPARNFSSKLTCTLNLKQFAIAAKMFDDAHAGYSWDISTNFGGTEEFGELSELTFRHFQVLSNDIYYTLGVICPQDSQRQAATNWGVIANTNISYFIGLDSKRNLPTSIIAGDRNISPSSVILRTTKSALPNWLSGIGLHGDTGHIAYADGHVEQLNSAGLDLAIQSTGIATNHFAVP